MHISFYYFSAVFNLFRREDLKWGWIFLAVQDSSISDIDNDYNDYNYFNDCKEYKDYNDYSNNNDYNNYRDSDLDLDWEQLSDLVTKLFINNKLRNLNHDIEG